MGTSETAPTFDAQSHLPLLHSSQGVFDLHQLAGLVERRQGEVHVPHLESLSEPTEHELLMSV